MKKMNKEKILLHICCAPCATESFRRLKEEEFLPVGYFYNPNIYPESEHDKRYDECVSFCKSMNYKLIEIDYDYQLEHKKWLKYIKGLESEKENGKRCLKCFEFRLKKAFEKAKSITVIGKYTTTLTISPYKDSKAIFEIAGLISADQKKKGNKISDQRKQNEKKEDKIKYITKAFKRIEEKNKNEYGPFFFEIDFKKKAGFEKSVIISKEHNLYRQHYCGCEFSMRDI